MQIDQVAHAQTTLRSPKNCMHSSGTASLFVLLLLLPDTNSTTCSDSSCNNTLCAEQQRPPASCEIRSESCNYTEEGMPITCTTSQHRRAALTRRLNYCCYYGAHEVILTARARKVVLVYSFLIEPGRTGFGLGWGRIVRSLCPSVAERRWRSKKFSDANSNWTGIVCCETLLTRVMFV